MNICGVNRETAVLGWGYSCIVIEIQLSSGWRYSCDGMGIQLCWDGDTAVLGIEMRLCFWPEAKGQTFIKMTALLNGDNQRCTNEIRSRQRKAL